MGYFAVPLSKTWQGNLEEARSNMKLLEAAGSETSYLFSFINACVRDAEEKYRLEHNLPKVMKDADVFLDQYLTLTDAMGYKDRPEEFASLSANEWATYLLDHYNKTKQNSGPLPISFDYKTHVRKE